MQVKISVVIITFNEEKNIERCLKSVIDISDEIIVLDSYSKDKTEEICKKYDVNFFQHKFDGHIEQKNRAITFANNKIVLSLDADEALSDELKKAILTVKKNWEADGYYFNRLTNYSGKWIRYCGWYPDQKLRLFDSTKGKWGGINPHDKYIMNKEVVINHLNGDLLHYSFHDIAHHTDQINKFSSIKAQMMFKKGKKYSFFKMYISATFKFFKSYILKQGFRDGFYGLVISANSAHSNFLKYIKLRELYQKNK